MISEVLNCDCMIGMKRYPDKWFDLEVVDPEFGIGIGNSARLVTDKGHQAKCWDDKPIDSSYFAELFRISKNQIIWGGNYYNLGITKHCIVWDKKQPEDLSFGMFDYSWTSFEKSNKLFRYSATKEKPRIHPTQKPVALYSWIYHNYLPEGGKVIDTHGGSMSNLIAGLKAGNIEMTVYEIDSDYYKAAKSRVDSFISQGNLFQEKPTVIWNDKSIDNVLRNG